MFNPARTLLTTIAGKLRRAFRRPLLPWAFTVLVFCCITTLSKADNNNSLLLDLLVKKGYVTQDEAEKLQTESDSIQSNGPSSSSFPKWLVGDGIKSVELFGDIRARFEDRVSTTPAYGNVHLNRYRYALRLGLRGDATDDFYYGLRLETASNPRSPWVTFGTSSSGSPYQGPFGKSQAGINVGQMYIGWRPNSNVDITVGKMEMPLYTTPMIWDSDINPEGAAERFKCDIGPAEFFANFTQLIYQDVNPDATPGLLYPADAGGNEGNPALLSVMQGGVKYQLTQEISFKAAASIYTYLGHGATNQTSNGGSITNGTPGFSSIYIGEGAGFPVVGASGFSSGSSLYDGYTYNQTGVNNLLILECPFEVNFKLFHQLRMRVFGDWAENLEGQQRAQAAVEAASNPNIYATPINIPYQPNQNKAYQIGLAFGNGNDLNQPGLGQVYGSNLRRGAWEMRVYWQAVEQYALDPNLLDSDFFEGAANLQGLYAAVAYSFSDAVVGTLRYGYASRIDKKLGTGGTDQDIPWVNPIDQYQLMQIDLTLKL
jgi:hypothetical protein